MNSSQYYFWIAACCNHYKEKQFQITCCVLKFKRPLIALRKQSSVHLDSAETMKIRTIK